MDIALDFDDDCGGIGNEAGIDCHDDDDDDTAAADDDDDTAAADDDDEYDDDDNTDIFFVFFVDISYSGITTNFFVILPIIYIFELLSLTLSSSLLLSFTSLSLLLVVEFIFFLLDFIVFLAVLVVVVEDETLTVLSALFIFAAVSICTNEDCTPELTS